MLVSRPRFSAFTFAVCLIAFGCAAPVRDADAYARSSTWAESRTAQRRRKCFRSSTAKWPRAEPLAGLTTLAADDVVKVVLERNPTLEQMRNGGRSECALSASHIAG